MADRLEQQLLGYLLDALDDLEQERVREQLAGNPALRRRLARLRKSLRLLDEARMRFVPPGGLTGRTCRFVAGSGPAEEAAETDPFERISSPPLPTATLAEVDARPAAAGGWSWKDLAVAAAIVVAATLLLFPAIENSRFNAQVEACSDNLRLLGHALAQYSQRHQNYFPPVPQEGRLASAGAFAPVLASMGYIESPRWLVCPASPLAEEPGFEIPSLEQVSATYDEPTLERLRTRMGGSYGYCLGFVENGTYHNPRNRNRAWFALMSDAPSNQLPGHQSLNHRGRGQNVLFEDFHVQFFTTPEPSGMRDHFFVNDIWQVAPGRHRNDSVIAGSGPLPVVAPLVRGR
jgi:hypothetical protein